MTQGLKNNGTNNSIENIEPLAFRQVDFGIKELVQGINPTVECVISSLFFADVMLHIDIITVRSIVAVHGLDGHWEKTWSTKAGVLWLRDLLPEVIPNARIISYGYGSRTHGTTSVSEQYIWQHAHALVTDLTHFREETEVSPRLQTRLDVVLQTYSLDFLDPKAATHFSYSQSRRHCCQERESPPLEPPKSRNI